MPSPFQACPWSLTEPPSVLPVSALLPSLTEPPSALPVSGLLSVALQTLQPRLQYLLEARSVTLNSSTGATLSAVVVRPAPVGLVAPAVPSPPLVTAVREPEEMAQLAREPWFLADR